MKYLLLVGALILNMHAFASDKGNGGDICENKMRNISNDIEKWLLEDEFKGIQLPSKVLEDDYKNRMLEAVKKSLLSCTSEKLFVGGAEKTCKNFQEENGDIRITCNFDRLLKTEEKEKYRLMHHELAGVAGLETNNGSEKSNYVISNQISEFLEKVEVLQLGIKKSTSVFSADHRFNFTKTTNSEAANDIKKMVISQARINGLYAYENGSTHEIQYENLEFMQYGIQSYSASEGLSKGIGNTGSIEKKYADLFCKMMGQQSATWWYANNEIDGKELALLSLTSGNEIDATAVEAKTKKNYNIFTRTDDRLTHEVQTGSFKSVRCSDQPAK